MTTIAPWPPSPSEPTYATDQVQHLLAPNANAWTYEGTNTWLIGREGGKSCFVVDPGADDQSHLDGIIAAARASGWTVSGILLTHNHGDHLGGAQELKSATGAAIYAQDAEVADEVLAEGQTLEYDGQTIEVLHTPGHSGDSVSFWLPEDRSLITGDTILGRRSSAIFGRVSDFLHSAKRLRALADRDGAILLPGHGPVVSDPVVVIDHVIAVRHRRVQEVDRLVSSGMTSIDEITDELYGGIDSDRRNAARMSVRANLYHIAAERGVEKFWR